MRGDIVVTLAALHSEKRQSHESSFESNQSNLINFLSIFIKNNIYKYDTGTGWYRLESWLDQFDQPNQVLT